MRTQGAAGAPLRGGLHAEKGASRRELIPHPSPSPSLLFSLQDAPDAWKPLERADMESDLTFKGLIIFRNELRPDSAETIAALKVRGGWRGGEGVWLKVGLGWCAARLSPRILRRWASSHAAQRPAGCGETGAVVLVRCTLIELAVREGVGVQVHTKGAPSAAMVLHLRFACAQRKARMPAHMLSCVRRKPTPHMPCGRAFR
jgi:hypothetical protein